jgi:F0F1-type ATP synthase membrane subunit c/vacuolar-type H+-ATPase subunit K
MTGRSPGMRLTPARPREDLFVTRLKVLVFGLVVLGGLIMLGVGWHVGRQARRACESIARERAAAGEHQYDLRACLAARLLNGGA